MYVAKASNETSLTAIFRTLYAKPSAETITPLHPSTVHYIQVIYLLSPIRLQRVVTISFPEHLNIIRQSVQSYGSTVLIPTKFMKDLHHNYINSDQAYMCHSFTFLRD